MASDMQFLSNFPVKFQNESDSCLECDGRDFCQLAQWNDRFEFAIEPGTTDIPITNGTFTGSLTGWTTTDWTYNSGKARITNSVDTIYQAVSTTAGRKYKITFTVSNYTGTGSLDVYLGGLYYGLGGIDHNGTYTVYITPNSSTELSFGCLAATCTLDLDNVTVELVNEDCGIELYNTETGTYSGIRKYANLTEATIGTIGYSYLWSDMGLLYDGCYKIVVYTESDYGAEQVSNGSFTGSAAGWTLDAGFTYSSNHIQVNVVGSSGASMYQELPNLITGQKYIISVTISSYVSGKLYIRNVDDDATPIGSVSANGTYTFECTYLDTIGTGYIEILANFPSDGATDNMIIDDVSVVSIDCGPSELSECYKLATTHECTKMLKWTNEDTNGFNYPYNSFYSAANSYGFQWMRVESDLRRAKYPGEAEKYIDSGGNNILYLGSVRKLKDFIVAMMPEYMHDALANGFKHKAFYIDGVRYTFEDTDYTPEWSTDIPTILAESTSLVGKYNQDNNSID